MFFLKISLGYGGSKFDNDGHLLSQKNIQKTHWKSENDSVGKAKSTMIAGVKKAIRGT